MYSPWDNLKMCFFLSMMRSVPFWEGWTVHLLDYMYLSTFFNYLYTSINFLETCDFYSTLFKKTTCFELQHFCYRCLGFLKSYTSYAVCHHSKLLLRLSIEFSVCCLFWAVCLNLVVVMMAMVDQDNISSPAEQKSFGFTSMHWH